MFEITEVNSTCISLVVSFHAAFTTETTGLMTATVKILKFGTPKTIAIIVLKIEKFYVTLH